MPTLIPTEVIRAEKAEAEGVKRQIAEIRRLPKLKQFDIVARVVYVLNDYLDRTGKLYHDDRMAYWFNNAEKRIYTIGEDRRFTLLMGDFGLFPTEKIYRDVVAQLYHAAMRQGTATTVHPFTYYDKENFCLYLSNHAGLVYKIMPDVILPVENGADQILFTDGDGYEPFELNLSQDKNISLFREVLLDPMRFKSDMTTPAEKKLLIELWVYSMFFGELHSTRMILALVGSCGSFKTSFARLIGQVMFGRSFDVIQLTNDSKDFDAMITTKRFAVLDNVDREVDWLDDRLAVAATGGNVGKRILYTTNDAAEFPVTAFLAVTSQSLSNRREDVMERTLLMLVERGTGDSNFAAESVIRDSVLERRGEVMTSLAFRLQEIVAALKEQTGREFRTSFRMADFADFALRISASEGRYEEMHGILKRLTAEQSAFSLEDSGFIESLKRWLSVPGNLNREITTGNLYKELLAQDGGFAFQDAMALGRHLSRIATNLKREYGYQENRSKAGGYRHIKFTKLPPEVEVCRGPVCSTQELVAEP